MKKLSVYLLIILFIACDSADKKAPSDKESRVLTENRPQSAAFNQSFKKIVNAYYQLKDQFVADDEIAVNANANQMLQSLDSLLIKELNGDSSLKTTAISYIEGISSEIKGLLGEKDLESKRKSFQMISEQLYYLIRTVQYDQEVIYQAYCPMAFNNDGASWLSNTSVISNPYIPKTMLTCGELRDTIDYRRKQ